MSNFFRDFDKMMKDLCGPQSKFYKNWMKGKEKRKAYIDKWVSRFIKKSGR